MAESQRVSGRMRSSRPCFSRMLSTFPILSNFLPPTPRRYRLHKKNLHRALVALALPKSIPYYRRYILKVMLLQLHERVDTTGSRTRDEKLQLRRLYVCTKVHQILMGFGKWTQYSLFECFLRAYDAGSAQWAARASVMRHPFCGASGTLVG